jgi:squalene-hopene/tetraprenyl-beta-curcumene cyclase
MDSPKTDQDQTEQAVQTQDTSAKDGVPASVPAPAAGVDTDKAERAEASSDAAPETAADSAFRRAELACDRARDYLLRTQDGEGWWKGLLETNVTMDAEDLLLREFLGIRTEDETAAAARWIRSQQREDGSWASFYGGPQELSTTIEAYVALRLAGDATDAPHMVKAREVILALGGIEASRVFTRIWLALFGEWSWDDLPVMPPELIFLPAWFPLNVYDWACWARQTVVPLTIINALRPNRPLPFHVTELRTGKPVPQPDTWLTWEGRFTKLDRLLHRYQKRPLRLLRRMAIKHATEWIIARQEADGCWGGIQPPWVYSIMALHLLGYPLDHPVLRKAIIGLDRYTNYEDRPGGQVRILEACQSPVWDTGLAVIALSDAGVAADDENLLRAGRWLLDEEITVKGDWSVRRPDLAPGGWAFEFDNDYYPDTDDTAEILMALRRTSVAGEYDARVEAAVGRAIAWLLGMQSKDGGWGAFDADNTQELCTRLPFCDFGAVIDPPSADVTAHIVEALCSEGMTDSVAVRRGVRWLRDAQESDGSWFGRWGANYVYGTGAVVPALIAAGAPADDKAIRRAVDWLGRVQNEDGGWGEDLRSYVDRAESGRGTTTASQTAWALLALLAAGERGEVVERGVAWLAEHQNPDGTWDEPEFTGTGFPGDFYLNYHLYRQVFPLTALGRYVGRSPAKHLGTVDKEAP